MRCATENSKHQIYPLSQAKEDETERKKELSLYCQICALRKSEFRITHSTKNLK